MPDKPMVLIDQPEDGYCETCGWVEATVTEDQARDMLTNWCVDENGEPGFRPTGPASKVHLTGPDGDGMWHDTGEGTEFWEVIVA